MRRDTRENQDATLHEVCTGQFPGRRNAEGHHIMNTFWSMGEAAEKCKEVVTYEHKARLDSHGEWGGEDCFDRVMELAHTGWDKYADKARMDVEETVRRIESEYALTHHFEPVHDFGGGMVDIDAYLHGQPENMISYPPVQTTSAGRVVAISTSISSSAGTSPDAYFNRGVMVASLVLAMERQGMQTELWLDDSAVGRGAYGSNPFLHGANSARFTMTNRVLVKSPEDSLDISKVMFAYAHTGALRHLAFGLMSAFPKEWVDRVGGYPGNYGGALDCNQVLPVGSIYLPCMFGEVNSDEMLVEYLTMLGVIEEGNN